MSFCYALFQCTREYIYRHVYMDIAHRGQAACRLAAIGGTFEFHFDADLTTPLAAHPAAAIRRLRSQQGDAPFVVAEILRLPDRNPVRDNAPSADATRTRHLRPFHHRSGPLADESAWRATMKNNENHAPIILPPSPLRDPAPSPVAWICRLRQARLAAMPGEAQKAGAGSKRWRIADGSGRDSRA